MSFKDINPSYMKKLLFILAISVLTLQGCTQPSESVEAAVAAGSARPELASYNYLVELPAHIQQALVATDNSPANNPITNDGATLGRVLFYDKNLSLNRTVSCGSCHKQASAFDDDVALSKGFANARTTRNSMSLLNLRFYKSGRMFWDERVPTVEKQALQPIQNSLEMGLTLTELESRVKSLTYYPDLFQKAFGSPVIDSVRIAKALAQFERSIVSYQSKYDKVKQGLETFTAAEARGEQIFLTAPNAGPGGGGISCAGCHTPPMFITSTPAGGFAFPLESGINGQNRFKSGSLRNIATRKFLFHAGTITDLNAMFTGPQPVPAHGVPPQDVAAMIAFLNTLTDTAITQDPKYADPFR
ncbi:cytochrome c peroxidase [Spirosoma fluviale]|uniref:Cytochrome c peroxidase n=2 Tax=Spirosoma fluviale TaxID=1597977 RepID=A0A286FI37_9BACT|nr:cytochrome c peroxidase [Spirosoma fluviale]